ncbi:hypothetical protein MCOR17_000945 [Pyricularia oryzae]|nr:hypothetical protein MCOR17_000945 [Pyricularia oryzae]KAI6508662.1 hypothetical protein MCOR13_002044 [Pyricularia oryzae]
MPYHHYNILPSNWWRENHGNGRESDLTKGTPLDLFLFLSSSLLENRGLIYGQSIQLGGIGVNFGRLLEFLFFSFGFRDDCLFARAAHVAPDFDSWDILGTIPGKVAYS